MDVIVAAQQGYLKACALKPSYFQPAMPMGIQACG